MVTFAQLALFLSFAPEIFFTKSKISIFSFIPCFSVFSWSIRFLTPLIIQVCSFVDFHRGFAFFCDLFAVFNRHQLFPFPRTAEIPLSDMAVRMRKVLAISWSFTSYRGVKRGVW